MALTAEEFEGQTVKSLKTLVAKQIGVPRFRQRWLSEDHTELQDEAVMVASDVQLVVLDYVEAEDGEVQKLFDACEGNHVDQVDELLRKPLSPNVVDEFDQSALHHAAVSGRLECAALLLEAGADKDAADAELRTAVHLAARNGHLEVVRLLLQAGASVAQADAVGRTALHSAAVKANLEVAQLLLEAGADKDATDNGGMTALHLTMGVVQLLLQADAGKDTEQTGECEAAWSKHLEVVQLLF